MSDWTAGYVADVAYTYGYYNELNPIRLRLAFLNAGLEFPEIGTACELGFGQGLSANLHAAASVTRWFGTDFNPTQAAFAQALASASNAGAKLYDEGFADFCQREDLPDFDFIALHGIWSWISDDNRKILVDFIRRKLKVGGVLYISYNTLPGWAAFAPMRHLLTKHVDILGSAGNGTVNSINGALDFAEKLLETKPGYSTANPLVAQRLKNLREQDRQYLAHEYFNRDWHPMHFGTVADWLVPAKLSYACSAHPLDHVDILNLTKDQQNFLGEIPDTIFRESVRDYIVNQQFRRDYWIKGPRKLNTLEQIEAIRLLRVVLTTFRNDVKLEATGALGEATLNTKIYSAILDVLGDYSIHSIGDVVDAVNSKEITFAQVVQAIMVLIGTGHVAAANDLSTIEKVRKQTSALNQYLLHKARGGAEVAYLASPVTGGGVTVNRFAQLFLLAISKGEEQPENWARFVWNILHTQGQKVMKDGQALISEADNVAEILSHANIFAEKQLPILKALFIA